MLTTRFRLLVLTLFLSLEISQEFCLASAPAHYLLPYCDCDYDSPLLSATYIIRRMDFISTVIYVIIGLFSIYSSILTPKLVASTVLLFSRSATS